VDDASIIDNDAFGVKREERAIEQQAGKGCL